MDITLSEIIRCSRENNLRHDWGKLSAMESLMLVVGECAEASECVRDGDMGLRYRADGKPEGLVSELADVIIRVCNLTGADISSEQLIEAVQRKLEFNFTRPVNHGRKI
jgi:NTP pyrophosphatase (non-canonical NTP hydrolase)